jgi:hypothetical protein
MSSLVYDISNEYSRIFGTRPKVGKMPDSIDQGAPAMVGKSSDVVEVNNFKINGFKKDITSTKGGSLLISEDLYGVEIWLPIVLDGLPDNIGDGGKLTLHYATIRLTGSSSIVRTPLIERKGSVKELYSIDDYKITIKGFFIDKAQRSFPEEDLINLRKVHEGGRDFKINNALTNVFLTKEDRVIMSDFELPEVANM